MADKDVPCCWNVPCYWNVLIGLTNTRVLQHLALMDSSTVHIVFAHLFNFITVLKGTVSQDGSAVGYKRGINRKVSLNPIPSEEKKLFC